MADLAPFADVPSFAAAAGLTCLTGGAVAGEAARAQPDRAWPEELRGAVSLTYDDGLNSASSTTHAKCPELKLLGLKATFFLTEENAHWRLERLGSAGP